MSTSLLTLETRLGQAIGDDLEFDTTTAVTASASVISTTLRNYDGGRDDYYNDWWVYCTEGANSTVQRQISDYATATGTLTVRGANLTAETAAITCRLHRYDRTLYTNAINDAIRETYPSLHRKLEDRTMVTANTLPDNSFELWTSSTASAFYSTLNASLTKTTTSGLIRGPLGTTSMKVTASMANGYAYISSDRYPRLLDLMGQTIDFKAWAYPQVSFDPFIVIYTLNSAGSTQLLSSATLATGGRFTLLELDDQTLNDDLVKIEFRFQVTTKDKYTYFDSARIVGPDVYEYLMLSDFADGVASRVFVQSGGRADYPCDDLHPNDWEEISGWSTIHDGNYLFLALPDQYGAQRQIRILGHTPFEPMDADSDTLELENEKVNLLVAYAKYKFYQAIEGPVNTQDTGRYQTQSAKAYNEYQRLLPKLKMYSPSIAMNIRGIK